MSNVINICGILEAKMIQINAQRVADKILERQRFNAELAKKIKAGEWRKRDEHRDL